MMDGQMTAKTVHAKPAKPIAKRKPCGNTVASSSGGANVSSPLHTHPSELFGRMPQSGRCCGGGELSHEGSVGGAEAVSDKVEEPEPHPKEGRRQRQVPEQLQRRDQLREILAEPSEEAVADLGRRGGALLDEHQARIDAYLHSEQPGREVVPRAIYYRYLKRIVANLLGIAHTATDPIQTLDHGPDGTTDTDD